MGLFHIILIRAGERIERHIIAGSAMQATLTAARLMPEQGGEFTLICKPGRLP